MTINESIYDRDIAPKLLEIGKICQVYGMSLSAHVEWDGGADGESTCAGKPRGIAAKLVRWAVQARGSLDALVIITSRYARETPGLPHNSLVLKILDMQEGGR